MAYLPDAPMMLPAYAELHALSNFSFQRGASHAEELVGRAAELVQLLGHLADLMMES